jgi:glutathione peroxidase
MAHSFTFAAIDGSPLPLRRFEGRPVLVVNTASACGFTPQYAGLQRLWDTYRDKGLVVLGVPSNDFGRQEPLLEDEIAAFCRRRFAVTFPLAAKTHVTGHKAHAFYKWAESQAGWLGKPRWNFHKYLVDGEGRLVGWFSTITPPDARRLRKAIEHQCHGGPS